MIELQEWQHQIRCRKCKDIIYSKFSGQFVQCSCGAIAVDQTPYYSRWIGDAGNFEEVENDKTDND